jgi:methylenetetrahydrofolate--tRNA-(uracil-5-)-methyltransferase
MTSRKNKTIGVTVLGAGLAGTEAVYQLIRRQIPVRLVEMRPKHSTGAHTSDQFAELVCSNSIGSNLPDRASGLLKEELRLLGSYIIDVAYKYRVPAGNALAVDRGAFAREITRYLKGHTLIDFVNDEATEIPDDGLVIVATGPLTSPALLQSIKKRLGTAHLEFFDAIAPLVSTESINMNVAFKADRYGEGEKGDYINCPMKQRAVSRFCRCSGQSRAHRIVETRKRRTQKVFQRLSASRNHRRIRRRFTALRPDEASRTDRPEHRQAPLPVVQLRQDNLLASLYNLVGFQTNLKHAEQKRVFRMIPGLEKAEFFRLGQMHRNSYINAPKLLTPTLQLKKDSRIMFAGQLCGVEGYTESAATGLVAGMNAVRMLQGKEPVVFPPETMIGSLLQYITFDGHKEFHPMNANFGIFKGEAGLKGDLRKEQIIKAARRTFREFCDSL